MPYLGYSLTDTTARGREILRFSLGGMYPTPVNDWKTMHFP